MNKPQALIFAVVTAVLTSGAGPPLTVSPLFRVSRISIEGLRLLEPGEITALSGIAAGTNLYEMNLQDAVVRIQAHPMVLRARIVRAPPDGVLITVAERAPLALTNVETLCGADEDGVLIPFHPTFVDLPVITGISLRAYALGQPISDEGFLRCLTLLKGIRAGSQAFWDQISEVRPAPDRVILSLVGDGLEVWMSADEVPEQVEKFLAWHGSAGRPALPSYVDLRFSGQIVLGPPKVPPGNEGGKTQTKPASPRAGSEPGGRR